ncbi:MAG TPA: amidohydrolase family protein [Planctomycetota bacterium]|nr:amidohydrolase family protein [Planctomycetota bacterium]
MSLQFLERLVLQAGFAALVLCCSAAPARAFAPQDEGGEGGEGQEAEVESDTGSWFAVVGGEVHTGTGAVLRGATVLAKDGRIRAVGQGLTLPEGTQVLDASGLRVYPGLVAVDSSGLIGNAGSDFADTIDPFNYRMVLALANGITTAAQSETPVKLKRGEIEDVVLREKYLVPQNYSTRNPTAKGQLEGKFVKAADYLRQYREWEEKKKTDKDLKEPSRRGVDAGVVSILRGEVLARFNADDRNELLGIARLAQRFGFRPVIVGCTEGWTVAGDLGRAGAYAVVTPRVRNDKSEELVREGGSSIENAAILHEHGVQVAIVPSSKIVDMGGIVGRDILHLTTEAGFAVRGGLSEQAAFEAITIVPARILGVDQRIGTLEVGKDCDLVVTDGDILHYQTFVQYAVVSGKQVYDKQAELYYAHIRPRAEAHLAPETRVDPGTEVEPEDEGEGQDDDEDDDSPEPEESGEDGDDDEGDSDGR